jgi:ribosomal protein S18 acetylase RimI-like enzyme
MVILYSFIIIIIILILIIFVYMRLKFPFWSKQPVFHIYDLLYYIFPPGIIRLELPDKEDKYNNFQNVKTIPFDKLSLIEKKDFEIFIGQHFLRNKQIHYAPKSDNIWTYMEGLEGGPTFISFYRKDNMLVNVKSNEIVSKDKIIGTMVSYPLQVVIHNGRPDAFFNIYYVDYLCVHSDYRNQEIAPQLIQTHHYNQRYGNDDIQISLFKREGELTAAVPLCFYTVYGYNIEKLTMTLSNKQLSSSIHTVEVSHKNMSTLVDFMKDTQHQFDISISPSLSNLAGLIKTENVYVYLLIENHEVLSAHFFKKQCSYVEEDKEILNCFVSIISRNISMEIIEVGFIECTKKIVTKYPSYSVLLVEDKSNNVELNKQLFVDVRPMYKIPCAYYFYNFAYPSFKPEKTLIMI